MEKITYFLIFLLILFLLYSLYSKKNKSLEFFTNKNEKKKKKKKSMKSFISEDPKIYQPKCKKTYGFDKAIKYNKTICNKVKPAISSMDKVNIPNKYKQELATHPDNMKNWGWSYMPPSSWSVPQKRPPPCIPQKECPVCPNMDDKYASPLKWTGVGSIMPNFIYKNIYNKDYYYPGWIADGNNGVTYTQNIPKCYGDKCEGIWKCNKDKCIRIKQNSITNS